MLLHHRLCGIIPLCSPHERAYSFNLVFIDEAPRVEAFTLSVLQRGRINLPGLLEHEE